MCSRRLSVEFGKVDDAYKAMLLAVPTISLTDISLNVDIDVGVDLGFELWRSAPFCSSRNRSRSRSRERSTFPRSSPTSSRNSTRNPAGAQAAADVFIRVAPETLHDFVHGFEEKVRSGRQNATALRLFGAVAAHSSRAWRRAR